MSRDLRTFRNLARRRVHDTDANGLYPRRSHNYCRYVAWNYVNVPGSRSYVDSEFVIIAPGTEVAHGYGTVRGGHEAREDHGVRTAVKDQLGPSLFELSTIARREPNASLGRPSRDDEIHRALAGPEFAHDSVSPIRHYECSALYVVPERETPVAVSLSHVVERSAPGPRLARSGNPPPAAPHGPPRDSEALGACPPARVAAVFWRPVLQAYFLADDREPRIVPHRARDPATGLRDGHGDFRRAALDNATLQDCSAPGLVGVDGHDEQCAFTRWEVPNLESACSRGVQECGRAVRPDRPQNSVGSWVLAGHVHDEPPWPVEGHLNQLSREVAGEELPGLSEVAVRGELKKQVRRLGCDPEVESPILPRSEAANGVPPLWRTLRLMDAKRRPNDGAHRAIADPHDEWPDTSRPARLAARGVRTFALPSSAFPNAGVTWHFQWRFGIPAGSHDHRSLTGSEAEEYKPEDSRDEHKRQTEPEPAAQGASPDSGRKGAALRIRSRRRRLRPRMASTGVDWRSTQTLRVPGTHPTPQSSRTMSSNPPP